MSSGPAERLGALRSETEAELRASAERIDAMTAARADTNSDDEHDPEGATWAHARRFRRAANAA